MSKPFFHPPKLPCVFFLFFCLVGSLCWWLPVFMFACCQKCQAHSLWFSPICCNCLNKYAYLQWGSTMRRTGQMKDLSPPQCFVSLGTPNTMFVQKSIGSAFDSKILLKCTAELLTVKCCVWSGPKVCVNMWLFEEAKGKLWLWRHTLPLSF